ncbi:MAG: ABC transporter ATP-binding protein [Oceanospirillales bacterium]|nr:ABC transporter ATP-binding protein [Oceanospirillales bacterium]
MGATISLDYITHQFSPSAAPTLEQIENRIEPGEMVALIGRSGCGKSTLLHMLAGLLIPSEGCVRINGHQVSKPSAKWNMMFQKASLYPWMSVKENAALGLLFAGLSKAEASDRVDELLDMVGLHDKKDVNVQSLSGGQQQRVALARSLATEPEVLLLDEPFSALDAFTRTALQEEVPAICRARGITMVIVTHDIDEAITMADRVLIMSQNPGRVVSELNVELSWPRRHMDADFQSLRDELMERFKGTDTGLSGRQSATESTEHDAENAA